MRVVSNINTGTIPDGLGFEEDAADAPTGSFFVAFPQESSVDRHNAGLSCKRKSVWRNQWMLTERPVWSSLLLEPLAMLMLNDVVNEREVLTSMMGEPAEVGGPEIIAADAKCEADAGMNDERLDRDAKLRGIIDNSSSVRNVISA
jgi:hypothetical protein